MRSRLLTLLILLAAAWGLYRWGAASEAARAPQPAGSLLFPGLETRAVDSLAMSFRTGHVLEVARGEGGLWNIIHPTLELAQREFVEVQLDNLARARVLPVEEQGGRVDAADVGLEPPRYQISFRRGEREEVLFLGERDAFDKGVYARKQGSDHVVLITNNVLTMVEQFRNQDYADKHLLRGWVGPVSGVRVETPAGLLLDATRTGDTWTLQEPRAVLADSTRVQQLVRTLEFAQQMIVHGYEPDDSLLSDAGLPTREQAARGELAGATLIELRSPGWPPARAYLASDWTLQEDVCFAVRGDFQRLLSIDKDQFALLHNEPDFFRQRRLLPPVRDRCRRLRIEREGEVLLDVISDGRESWSFRHPTRLAGQRVETRREAGRSSLSDLLTEIDALQVAAFRHALPEGPPQASLTVTWVRGGAERTDRVDLFDLDQDLVGAVTTERPEEGLLLEPEALLALLRPFTADRLRSLSPVTLERSRWRRLEIEGPALEGPVAIQRPSATEPWTGDDPWGRRYGLGLDVLERLTGLVWRPALVPAEVPWRVRYLDGDGGLLGELGLRRPGPGEAPEELGVPVVLGRWSGAPGLELALPEFWWEALVALGADQSRG